MSNAFLASKQFLGVFVKWARSKGLVRPKQPDALKLLMAQCAAEMQVRAEEHIEYVLKVFGEDPPIIAASDPQLNMLRTDGDMFDVVEHDTENSDFTDIIRQREEAMEEAQGDDLAREVIYRDNVEARNNDHAPIFSEAPPSWNKAVMGNIIVVQPPSSAGQQGPIVQVVNWPGDDRECRPVTLDFGPVPAQVSAAGALRVPGTAVSRPFALVQWGTSQGLYSALVDCGSGMHLCISCSSVMVSIGLDDGSTASMEVYGSMSFGAAPHPTPATRTNYIDALTNGGTAIRHRPPFATTIVALDRSDFTIPVTLNYKDLAGNTIGQRIFAASTTLDAPIFLPNDAIEIDLVNGGGAPANFRITYGLTL